MPTASEKIVFFGDVDKNKRGTISSQYPAYTMLVHVDELKESIASKQRQLDRGVIPPADVPEAFEVLAREKARLEKIEASRPELSDGQKDRIAKEYKRLAKEISNSLFTRSEMQMGTASAHEEARRMVNPIIKVDPEIAEACNIQTTNGMVSRNDASRIFKIIGHTIGEATNVETLRKDKRTR